MLCDSIVADYAAALGLELSPHDLRRTCARLCRLSGGALEQIQFLLGHASVQTTERYLGGKQELQVAVNDKLGVGLRVSERAVGTAQEVVSHEAPSTTDQPYE